MCIDLIYILIEYAPDVKIPSVFLASTVFWEISYWLQMENRPMMVLLYVNGDSVFAQYVLKSPLMVIAALLILSAPAIVILCYLFVSYIRARQFKKQQVASINVVSNLIKKIFYHDKLNENDSESCIICLEDYSDGDELRVLPCNHYYHTNCVDAWLTTQKKECPICRRDITVTNIESASLLVTEV
ncbi:MAG: hypothetical protein EXX96DRAFT_580322 [Benjaminiella poitrasii]|nr:MAG: hypothetical protein EXX96DRAFT_580322 [Benjaminiella poitrasii]